MPVRIDVIAGLGQGHWVAWWYGGFKENDNAPGEMFVAVNFRRITGTNPEGITVTRNIGVTQIGQVPLGSIWYRGERVRNLRFVKRTFEVEFTANPEQFVTLQKCADKEMLSAFGQKWPPLFYSRVIGKSEDEGVLDEKSEVKPTTSERSYLIKLATAQNHYLILPCMELFSRLYGRSAEVKRAIVGYPWIEGDHGAIGRLYANIEESLSNNIWKVKLQRKTVNADVVFLAHAKYDPFTIAAVRSIHTEITKHKDEVGQNTLYFPKIRPWFEGTALLMVDGIELNEHYFFGLRILGASDPDGVLIERDRVDRDKIGQHRTDEERDRFEIEAAKRIRARIKPPIVNLTADMEPDQGSAIVEVENDPFNIIGIRRPVVDRPARVVRRGEPAINMLGAGNESRFSGNAEFGSKKGVGAAYIQASEVVESLGAQIGMWNALIEMQRSYPNRIAPIEWYTFEDGYNASSLPKQIPFVEYIDAAKRERNGISRKAVNWIYIDQSNKTMRSLLTMRIRIDGESIFFVELSRRQNENPRKGGDKEESFRGLAFRLYLEDELNDALIALMDVMPHVSGVMKNVLSGFRFPGDAYAYRHSAVRKKRARNNTADSDQADRSVPADLYLLAVKKALSEFNVSI
jgi:hypothetical protein